MIACGTILGQIYIFAVDVVGDSNATSSVRSSAPYLPSTNESKYLPSWNHAKWSLLVVLQDFSASVVDEFWNLIWTPDSSHIFASGSCKSRTEFDHEDGDLKVLPSPIVVFDLRAHLDAPLPDDDTISLEARRRHGIKRYEGHIEEVVNMKLWKLETPALEPEFFLFTSSQDGHVRKWKFDKFWNQLESSSQIQDDETWMAFSLSMIYFPSVSVPSPSDAPSAPTKLIPRSLFLLAGDRTLKLFDPVTNIKLYTFEPLYDTYCTSVEVYNSTNAIEHPKRPGIFLNGDGRVYRDSACTRPMDEEPPTFLILTKGIDYLAPSAHKMAEELANKKSQHGSDVELDELDANRKSSPTRVHLHILTIPLQHHSSMVPSMKSGSRRTEIVHRFAADTTRITLETVYVFSHPLLDCNYWPAKLTHNGNHVLSVSGNGSIFAWALPKTAAATQSAQMKPKPTPTSPNSLYSAMDATAASKPKSKPIIASHMMSAIFASHDEDLPTRDILFHPFWPLMFTASDDGSVHVWSPSLVDPVKNVAIPIAGAEPPPAGASLTSVIVPKGSNVMYSQPISSGGSSSNLAASAQQQGSAYRSAVEAAMLASVGALMPAVAKRKRGRPPKRKIIEEIEAQFAAQERAMAEQQASSTTNPSSMSGIN